LCDITKIVQGLKDNVPKTNDIKISLVNEKIITYTFKIDEFKKKLNCSTSSTCLKQQNPKNLSKERLGIGQVA